MKTQELPLYFVFSELEYIIFQYLLSGGMNSEFSGNNEDTDQAIHCL
ncbi:hypothetical protein DOT_5119 [Desulfosporosinus sp. OT]|nr:hypothetical protein DOT_5119 [Desulfosporosinus sp. OT]